MVDEEVFKDINAESVAINFNHAVGEIADNRNF